MLGASRSKARVATRSSRRVFAMKSRPSDRMLTETYIPRGGGYL